MPVRRGLLRGAVRAGLQEAAQHAAAALAWRMPSRTLRQSARKILGSCSVTQLSAVYTPEGRDVILSPQQKGVSPRWEDTLQAAKGTPKF